MRPVERGSRRKRGFFLPAVIRSPESLPHGVPEGREARRHVGAEMQAQDAPPALAEHLEVALCLRRLDGAETVLMPRQPPQPPQPPHIEIGGVVAGDVQKHAGVRAALIGLTGRMEKARSEAETGGDPLAVADHDADRLQRFAVKRIALDISEERAIVPGPQPLEVRREIFDERAGGAERFSGSARRQRVRGRAP
jgi:hypothetical protein